MIQKWEATRGIGYSFGYNQNEGPEHCISVEDLVHTFVDIVSKNGNLLLNVPPRADGTLDDGTVAICSVHRDGSGFRQLTDGSIRYLRSSLSPDGTSILAVSASRGFELYVMDGDGTNQRRVPNVPQGAAFASWSPDGEKIVYATATPPPNPGADIYVINRDGTGDTRLTHAEGVSEYPCWSPDGTEIAFQTSRYGNFEIYVMDADGSNLRRLTDHPGSDGRPSWRVVER